jgi:hypothetical protein
MSEISPGSLPPPLPGAPARRPWILIGLTLVIYAVSLFLPALHLDKDPKVWLGAEVLMMGWLGPLMLQFGWVANPLGLAAIIFLIFRQWTLALIVAVIALLLGLSSLTIVGQQLYLDEGGVNKALVLGLGPAFHVWMAALVLPAVATILGRLRRAF